MLLFFVVVVFQRVTHTDFRKLKKNKLKSILICIYSWKLIIQAEKKTENQRTELCATKTTKAISRSNAAKEKIIQLKAANTQTSMKKMYHCHMIFSTLGSIYNLILIF